MPGLPHLLPHLRKITAIAVLAAILGLTTTGTVLAGEPSGDLPAPGILGLIAFGIIGAIALTKSRK